MKKVTRDLRKVCNWEHHNYYSLLNINVVILRRMGWAQRLAHSGQVKDAHKLFSWET